MTNSLVNVDNPIDTKRLKVKVLDLVCRSFNIHFVATSSVFRQFSNMAVVPSWICKNVCCYPASVRKITPEPQKVAL